MNQAPDFVLFLGRFHPLVVHLPIGFLFFAFVLELYSKWKNTPALTQAIPLALFCGFGSALIACVLGYMLSLSGDYDANTLDTHFWFGVATTVIALLAWLIRIDKIKLSHLKSVKANISTLALIVILLSVTGHYGGNLTHGSDYLTKYAPFGKSKDLALVPVTNVEDAVVFSYLVNPILQDKCASCHNADKKKGGLSLQDSLAILKGGKNGDVLIAGDSKNSELTRRVLLNPHHDDFMPPEGKTPLTEEEVAILSYWIDNTNANFNAKLGSVETPEDIQSIAANMLNLSSSAKGETKLPTLSTVNDDVLNDLIAEGFVLRELIFESNLYEVVLPSNFIKEDTANLLDSKFEKLLKIKDHIIWFYAEDNLVKDKHLKTINEFKNLQKLVINRNPITDMGVSALKNHPNINSLNIYKTNITEASLATFSNMPKLKKAYVWSTKINKEHANDANSMPELIFGL
ncbi:ribonuclease inhibitor [Postechiella marina]|uniref:Ribonuclease inhibitor n=1 Tax=Postechiella marina TaxID=943941 RepID=A0ABP8CFA2_9FLAO